MILALGDLFWQSLLANEEAFLRALRGHSPRKALALLESRRETARSISVVN
jgi:hypothetical protein